MDIVSSFLIKIAELQNNETKLRKLSIRFKFRLNLKPLSLKCITETRGDSFHIIFRKPRG